MWAISSAVPFAVEFSTRFMFHGLLMLDMVGFQDVFQSTLTPKLCSQFSI